jgi:hypothetical protein
MLINVSVLRKCKGVSTYFSKYISGIRLKGLRKRIYIYIIKTVLDKVYNEKITVSPENLTKHVNTECE